MNYVPQPAYHVMNGYDDHMRAGLYWEPIANSPPSYILEGFSNNLQKPPQLWPPQVESTLSWLGAIEFGAAYVVNFVIAAQGQRRNPDYRIIDMPSHINAQGNCARIATKLLPGLLPDLTDPVAGRPLQVSVTKSGRYPAQQTLPAGT